MDQIVPDVISKDCDGYVFLRSRPQPIVLPSLLLSFNEIFFETTHVLIYVPIFLLVSIRTTCLPTKPLTLPPTYPPIYPIIQPPNKPPTHASHNPLATLHGK